LEVKGFRSRQEVKKLPLPGDCGSLRRFFVAETLMEVVVDPIEGDES
jgi:hypothetical protein